jgi:hypothetical protein
VSRGLPVNDVVLFRRSELYDSNPSGNTTQALRHGFRHAPAALIVVGHDDRITAAEERALLGPPLAGVGCVTGAATFHFDTAACMLFSVLASHSAKLSFLVDREAHTYRRSSSHWFVISDVVCPSPMSLARKKRVGF